MDHLVAGVLLLVLVPGCVSYRTSQVSLPPSPETMVAAPEIRAVRLNDGETVRFASVAEMRWTADALVIRGDVDYPGNSRTVSFPRWNVRALLVDDGGGGGKAAMVLGWGVGAIVGFIGGGIAFCMLVPCSA